MKKSVKKCCAPCSSGSALLQTIVSFVPILSWLPRYRWRADLMHDVIGGLTVGIMHVPQGLISSFSFSLFYLALWRYLNLSKLQYIILLIALLCSAIISDVCFRSNLLQMKPTLLSKSQIFFILLHFLSIITAHLCLFHSFRACS